MTKTEAIEIYKERAAKFKNTQSIQWKMNLSVWTLLVLAIYNKKTLYLSGCNLQCITMGCIGLVGIIVFHGWYCFMTQNTLNYDKAFNDMIMAKLNSSDGTEIVLDLKKEDIKQHIHDFGWPWIIIQTAITIILVMVYFSN